METKALTINGKVYAYYQMDGNILYLKMLIELRENTISSENLLIHLIQLVEKRLFATASYLNINPPYPKLNNETTSVSETLPIIKLHHPTGHPLWQQNRFRIEINGEFIDLMAQATKEILHAFSTYQITIGPLGIYIQYFHCSSGTGFKPLSDEILLIHKATYSKIEYVGKPLLPPQGAFYSISHGGHNY